MHPCSCLQATEQQNTSDNTRGLIGTEQRHYVHQAHTKCCLSRSIFGFKGQLCSLLSPPIRTWRLHANPECFLRRAQEPGEATLERLSPCSWPSGAAWRRPDGNRHTGSDYSLKNSRLNSLQGGMKRSQVFGSLFLRCGQLSSDVIRVRKGLCLDNVI